MITAEILSNGILSHPVFKSNQVLTEAHLNKVVKFLEGQTRISRVNLAGTGVVCGFEPSLHSGNTALDISAGCGITTEGYVVSEPAVTLKYYGRASFDSRFDHSSILLPAGTGLSEAQTIIYELFSEEEHAANLRIIRNRVVGGNILSFSEDLTSDNIDRPLVEWVTDLVPVLYVEIQDYDNDPCENGCDEAGGQRDFILRRLLMTPEHLRELLKIGLGVNTDAELESALYGKFYLPELSIRRYGYGNFPDIGNGVQLEAIDSLEIFRERFENVFHSADETGSNLLEKIEDAYQKAELVFATFYTGNESADFADLAIRLENQAAFYMPGDQSGTGELPAGPRLGIQYFYDYLADLIDAYTEFREVAFDLMEDCLPPRGRFARHLMLGEFRPLSDCKPLYFRHHFTQPPIYNGNAERTKEVRQLFARMKQLAAVNTFTFPPSDSAEIRISPGKGPDMVLSRRAIPYYYGPKPTSGASLHEVWSYELNRRCRRELLPAYFADHALASWPNALFSSNHALNFFRIEGHFGLPFETALDRIKQQISSYNLPIDVVAVKLGKLVEDENVQYDFRFDDLEALFVKLREDLVHALEELDEDTATEQQIQEIVEFLNRFETIDEALATFASESEFTAFNNLYHSIFQTGDTVPNDCSFDVFERLVATYSERKQKISEQFLFHNYAKTHPGMEHLAGVYKGGTFILVYTSREELVGEEKILEDTINALKEKFQIAFSKEELSDIFQSENGLLELIRILSRRIFSIDDRFGFFGRRDPNILRALQYVSQVANAQSNTVIADFSLPYRCCGDSPAFNYIIKRNPPVLILEPDTFCVDDATSYEFVAVPQGGRIFGPGTREEAGERCFFRPSDAVTEDKLPLTADLTLEVGYEYDGDITRIYLTLKPLPLVGFSLSREKVCVDSDAVELIPDAGIVAGTFTAWLDSEEIDGIESDGGKYYFDPVTLQGRVDLEQEVIVTIQHYRIDEGGCDDLTTRELIVEGPRDTSFTIPEGTAFCVDRQQGVELRPSVNPGGTFTARLTDGPILPNAVEGNMFFPDRVPMETGESQVSIEIVYTYGDEICTNASPPTTITIESPPDAGFSIREDENGNNRLCISPDPISPEPVTSFSSFQVFRGRERDETKNMTDEMVTTDNRIDLSPLQEYMDGEQVDILVVHTIAGPVCQSEEELILTILPAPMPNVTIRNVQEEEVGKICLPYDRQIQLIITSEVPDGMEENFAVVAGNGVTVQVEDNKIQVGEYLFESGDEEVIITVEYELDNQEGCTTSTSRSVTVIRPPSPTFSAALRAGTSARAFQVTLSDILPEDGDKYTLRATFTRETGEDPLVIEQDFELSDPELELRYAAVGPDLEVGLQLIVERLRCVGESEILTEPVPIYIEGFQMLGLERGSGADGAGAIGTGFIQDGQVFSEEDFAQFGGVSALFNIRAVTVPEIIGGVQFRMALRPADGGTSPGYRHRSRQPNNYRLQESGLFGIPLQEASYSLNAETYYVDTSGGLQGPATSISFRIEFSTGVDPFIEEEDDRFAVAVTSGTSRDDASAGIDLLRSRAAALKSDLERFGQSRKLTSTKAYGMAHVFLSVVGSVAVLSSRYEDTASNIISSIKRAKSDRKEDYMQLLSLVSSNYLDKLVAANSAEIPEEARNVLKVVLSDAKKTGMKLADIRKEWDGNQLEKGLAAEVVGKYNRLLR
jgi:hypothetical protein